MEAAAGSELSPATAVSQPPAAPGLSEAEASRRLAARPPETGDPSTRSYASIVRANVLTVFNVILLAFGLLTLIVGEWQDALFLAIVVANAGIGIAQEVRAKLALDALSALVAPTGTVVREGRPRAVPVDEVLEGDLVELAAGDQIVADGRLLTALDLSLDESFVTGESQPVQRQAGETVRSGSFAVEGTGTFLVTAVGPASYAAGVAGEARTFRHPRSPLELALNRLLFTLVAVLVPLGALLGFALWERDTGLREAVETSVAAGVTIIPEGLVLLASLTYAVASMRMARRGALAQQLNAVESLASVDVICLDKTGTLTEPRLRVVEAVPADGVSPDELARALATYAAAAPAANATLQAIRESHPAEAAPADAAVPFSSRRRWGAVAVAGRTLVLGAPELFRLGPLAGVAEERARAGRRVLALGDADGAVDAAAFPPDARPLGLVVLAERLRPDVEETVAFFRSENVALKILSGDRPETVGAIARDAGLESSGVALDGRQLPENPAELRRAVLAAGAVGRISPEGKRRVVEALASGGHYVAMVGDGVNDVPALKASRLAIAQGSGTQMARSVADLVLVRGDFAAVPQLVHEGRKILRNLQRVTNLYVTKSAFAVFLILTVGLTPTLYPLLPRHLTLAAGLTIGIPTFFLALAPSAGAYEPLRFLRNVGRFALPAGTAAGLAVVSSYSFALNVVDVPLVEARTVATTALVLVGLYLIVALEASTRRRSVAVGALSLALGAVYVLVLVAPVAREFFELAPPGPELVIAVVGAAFAVAGLWLVGDRFAAVRRPHS